MNQRCKDCEYLMFAKTISLETGKKKIIYWCGNAGHKKHDYSHLLVVENPSHFRKCDLFMKGRNNEVL